MTDRAPRVAIVHEWLTNQGGSERVVWALHQAFPQAPIYTSVFNARALPQFAGLDVRTSFLQRWPLARTRHQLYPTLRKFAFESFDLDEFDVVISSSHAEAKGVLTRPETLHLCYCHTPTRYYWSDYASYRRDTGLGLLSPLVRPIMPLVTHRMRLWDFAAAQRVDQFLANSAYVARRIEKYYRREARVVHPPIDAARFSLGPAERRGFVAMSRLIPYKRMDLAVAACTELGLPLTVIGTGREEAALRAMAGPTVRFVGALSDADVAAELGRAQALIFCAEEDFGLIPLEAMACGTPVIAFGRGGATETVLEGETGTLFAEQTVASLVGRLRAFDPDAFDPAQIRRHAERFDQPRFVEQIRRIVSDHMARD